uniref:Uncharacterized protein n=1 Tax=Ciona savignyi TaxID=51511 RepID=H2YL27_CIOSA
MGEFPSNNGTSQLRTHTTEVTMNHASSAMNPFHRCRIGSCNVVTYSTPIVSNNGCRAIGPVRPAGHTPLIRHNTQPSPPSRSHCELNNAV